MPYARPMSAPGYESWFLSARDPASPSGLWIRHTRHRPRRGQESVALWCTLAAAGRPPAVVKQVSGAFPPGAVAGPHRFRGSATLTGQTASWDLSVSSEQAPLRPLRPALLERAPLPRTKLVASVPDGLVTGTVEAGGQPVTISGWRGTVGHNWGAGHADTWVWLHADTFATAPDAWLELVLARIRVGRALLPWTAMGALSLGGDRIPLGGLGRRPRVTARPGGLHASVPSPGARLELSVTTADGDAVAVRYADPAGGSRSVRHALVAVTELTLHRPGRPALALATGRAAYEYGSSQGLPGIPLAELPEG